MSYVESDHFSCKLRDNRRMRFSREMPSHFTIRHVEHGMIRVGEETYTDNVCLFRQSVDSGWSGKSMQDLSTADFAQVIEAAPEIVIIGSGFEPVLPPRELVFAFARKGIGFEVMDTPAACRTYNILVSEDRDVAALLILS